MYQHIMVPLDGSKLAECVLPHVEAITGGCKVGKVTLARVVVPLHFYAGLESRLSSEERQHLEAKAAEDARIYLEEIVGQLKNKGIVARFEVLQGRPASKLIDYTSGNGVDLIIMSTHGYSGVSRWIHGRIAARMLQGSNVPVLMVRAPGSIPPPEVLD